MGKPKKTKKKTTADGHWGACQGPSDHEGPCPIPEVKEVADPPSVRDSEGCPTEVAVLRRQWFELRETLEAVFDELDSWGHDSACQRLGAREVGRDKPCDCNLDCVSAAAIGVLERAGVTR